MHARHRNGGKGFRSNPMGMGASASRSSPDVPVRGGFYNSEYRNINRGFGHGQPKSFPSLQPSLKGDLLMEAGRLAADYLVAKGMLPPNALPPKFQNGGFKKEAGDFQDGFLPLESRTSALARLGSFEGGSDRKRFLNDFRTTGSKHNFRGNRKTGSYNTYDSDRGQENGRTGSVSGRSRVSSDKEADDDALSVHCDEQLTVKDVGGDALNIDVGEMELKSDNVGKSICESETQQPETLHSSKTNMSAAGEDYQLETSMKSAKESDDFGNLNVEDGEMKDSKNDEELGQHCPTENSVMPHSQVVVAHSSKNWNDLLQLCDFAKVPTRPRSLKSRGFKSDKPTNTEEGSNCAATSIYAVKPIDGDAIDRSLVNLSLDQTPSVGGTSVRSPVDPESHVDDNVIDVSQVSGVSDQNLDLTANRIVSPDNSDQSVRNSLLLDQAVVGESKCMGSLSFPDRSFAYGQESCEGLPGSQKCGSIDDFVPEERRGEKRVLDESGTGATYKKSKVWSPPMIAQADEYSHLSNLSSRGPTVIERNSPANGLMVIDQESSSRISGFPALGHNNSICYIEDKQIIDSSFKICDLNLMEGSDINENRDGSQMMFFSSMSKLKKESLSVDGGLTINGNSNMSHKYGTLGSHGKDVDIIDLESDFADDRTFRTAEKREEYTGLESFPSHAQGASDGTDVQDGYGLMISELLGNEIPNCSTVTGGIGSLHNDMDLHNGQEMLPEDDPIYMSLGEIPISFWEPPNPEFGKPF